MKHRFDDILAFLQTTETGNASAAAQRMGLSKSVISKRISDLEGALKVELLQSANTRRNTNGYECHILSTRTRYYAAA